MEATENIFRETWNRRSMIWALAINDLKLRYKNSFFGFVWSFLEPLLLLAIIYLVFTTIFKQEIENYPLYLLMGLIIWNTVERGTNTGIMSMLTKANIIKKISVRRELLVISTALTTHMMLFFELIVFGIFMAFFGIIPPITVVLLPLVFLTLFALILGLSLILGSLNVFFRDIQPIWHVILRAGFFLTPIFYTFELLPSNIQDLLRLNPVVGIMELSRAFTIDSLMPDSGQIFYTVSVSIVILLIGFVVFRRLDQNLVEEL